MLSRISSSDSDLVPINYLYEDRNLWESVASFNSSSEEDANEMSESPIQIFDASNELTGRDRTWTVDHYTYYDRPYYSSLEGSWTNSDLVNKYHKLIDGVYVSVKYEQNKDKSDKSSQNSILKLNTMSLGVVVSTDPNKETHYDRLKILEAADVKNPNWDNGFSDVRLGGDDVAVDSAIKQYKSYATSIGGETYNNWASNGMYDMAATYNDAGSQIGNTDHKMYVYGRSSDSDGGRWKESFGWIGPGPLCLLLYTEALNAPNDHRSIFNTQCGEVSSLNE